MSRGHSTLNPAQLSYNALRCMQNQREPAAAQPFASALTGAAPRPGEVAVQQAKPGPLLASLPTAMDLAGITASLLGGASGGGAVPARRPGDAGGPGLLQALDRGTGAPTEQPATARRTAERSVRDELPGSGHVVEGLPDGGPSRPGTSQALPPMRPRTDDGPAAKPWQRYGVFVPDRQFPPSPLTACACWRQSTAGWRLHLSSPSSPPAPRQSEHRPPHRGSSGKRGARRGRTFPGG